MLLNSCTYILLSIMSQAQQPTPGNPSTKANPTVVETNNFHEVLKYFNDDGQLKDENTQFAIPCAICLDKNLAIPCRAQHPTLETHEPYAVLSRCGHGFGYSCLYDSLVSYQRRRERPQCPMCRQPVEFWSRGCFRLPPIFLGHERRDDIRRARATLDGNIDPDSITSIIGETDPYTIPVEEGILLIKNFTQLGTEDELMDFLRAVLNDEQYRTFVTELDRIARNERSHRQADRGNRYRQSHSHRPSRR